MTDTTVTENTSDSEAELESFEERSDRLDREKLALRSSAASDSLRARLLALLGGNQYFDIDNTTGISPERALFRYAAATSKAVGMALQGTEYVCSNEPFECEFSSQEAAYVLCGLSALLDQGPDLIDDIRTADSEAERVERQAAVAAANRDLEVLKQAAAQREGGAT
jgi:hypothetical protein